MTVTTGTRHGQVTTPAGQGRVRRSRRAIRALQSYVVLLPALGLIGLFLFYPFFQAIFRSLFNWNGSNVSEFIGLGNYTELLLRDDDFRESIIHAGLLTTAFVTQSLVVPLLAAWLIHHIASERSKYWARILVILPAVAPTILLYLLWGHFLQEDGLVNRLLETIGLGSFTQPWLGDPGIALYSIMLVGFPWLNGVNTLIYLAGFLNIPRDLYDSARVDGARAWQVFRKLELPMLRPQTRLLGIIALIIGLQNYEHIFVITQGGPVNATTVPGLMLYNNAFRYGQFGYASAIGVLIFLAILILTLILLRVSRKDVHD